MRLFCENSIFGAVDDRLIGSNICCCHHWNTCIFKYPILGKNHGEKVYELEFDIFLQIVFLDGVWPFNIRILRALGMLLIIRSFLNS